MIINIILLTIIELAFMRNLNDINRLIAMTDYQYKLVKDYEVDITVSMEVPAFRMPKKQYKVFFKQPDLIQIKSKGFGILPKTGIFTSPIDNFDNLSNISIKKTSEPKYPDDIVISGFVIIDSLKIEMPNEYSKLTFKPTVDVLIDTSKWVIKSVITKIDTLKIFEIYNYYDIVDNNYYMPIKSEIKYFLKDKKISNWLSKDINSTVGSSTKDKKDEIIEGNIIVNYNHYIINKGISQSIFEE